MKNAFYNQNLCTIHANGTILRPLSSTLECKSPFSRNISKEKTQTSLDWAEVTHPTHSNQHEIILPFGTSSGPFPPNTKGVRKNMFWKFYPATYLLTYCTKTVPWISPEAEAVEQLGSSIPATSHRQQGLFMLLWFPTFPWQKKNYPRRITIAFLRNSPTQCKRGFHSARFASPQKPFQVMIPGNSP